MKKIVILFIAAIFLFSCGEKHSQARIDYEESLQEVLDGHDLLMKDLGKINSLIDRLEPKIDTTDEGIDYGSTVQKLKDAHDFMFSWMRDFSKEFPDVAEKNKTFTDEEYVKRSEGLEKQKKILSELEKAFEESISKAESMESRGK